MQAGLLWFDDSPTRETADKIRLAAARYQQKYGHAPDVCYVHPAHMAEPDAVCVVDDVRVLGAKTVLPFHFWLGVDETAAQAQARADAHRARLMELAR